MTWDETTLLNKIHIKHGYAFKGEYFVSEGKYMVLTPGNFNESGGFRVRDNKEKYYSGEIPEGYILEKSDLIIAMTEQGEGLLGSAALIPENDKYLHNQRIGLVSFQIDKLDGYFLYLLFNTSIVRQQIRNSSSGTKVRHTSPERIYRVNVRLPSLKTQQKIAAILSAYDDLIQNNKRRIALLEKMAEEIYREWFVRFRFPGYQTAEFEKGIPKGWVATPLGKLSKNHDSKRIPLSGPERDAIPGNIPYYGAAKVMGYISKYIFDGRYLLFAEDGSVITNEGFPVLQLTNGRFWVNNHAHILEGFGGVSTEWLFLSLKKYPVQGLITGAAQPKITQGNLNRIFLLNPNLEIHELFKSTIDPIFEQIANLIKVIEVLTNTKNTFLSRLISGKLSVEDLDIQFPPSMQEDSVA
jgi:type I restriction enzyme S subunit